MTARPLRVLLVEDEPLDADLVLMALRDGGFEPTSRIVETEAEFTDAVLGAPWDVVIADYNVPSFDAPASLAAARRHAPDVPFIVVSGVVGEEAAVATMKAGAVDYLRKDHLERLAPAVSREIQEVADRLARRAAEAALLGERAARAIDNARLAGQAREAESQLHRLADLLDAQSRLIEAMKVTATGKR